MKSNRLVCFACILFVLAASLLLPSCRQKLDTPAGKAYYYQCYWVGGPNDFSPFAEFAADKSLVHHDDSGTITGTWSNVEETITWKLNNPPKNTSFRGTYDRKGIAGNITDDTGGSGTFQGSVK